MHDGLDVIAHIRDHLKYFFVHLVKENSVSSIGDIFYHNLNVFISINSGVFVP